MFEALKSFYSLIENLEAKRDEAVKAIEEASRHVAAYIPALNDEEQKLHEAFLAARAKLKAKG